MSKCRELIDAYERQVVKATIAKMEADRLIAERDGGLTYAELHDKINELAALNRDKATHIKNLQRTIDTPAPPVVTDISEGHYLNQIAKLEKEVKHQKQLVQGQKHIVAARDGKIADLRNELAAQNE